MSGPRIGELFAGYGGLGMGVKAVLGSEVAWVSEIDKGACKVLAHRFPGVPNHGDITTIDWSQVEPVEVLTGGFPCQDVSSAGKRAGIRPGTRSGLWAQFAYAIDQLRPSLVVIENVRGLLSAEAHSDVEPCPWCVGDDPDGALRALGAVLGDLADLRFDAEWVGVPASSVGAPHGRWREFITAWPAADTQHPQLERVGQLSRLRGRYDTRPDLPRLLGTPTARNAPRSDRFAEGRNLSPVELALLPTPAVNDMGEGKTPEAWDDWTAKMKAAHGNGNGHGASLAIEAQRLLPTPTTQDAANAGGPSQQDRNTIPLNALRTWGDYTAAIHRWEQTLGRPAPAPTQTSSKGNPQLAPAFVEWMMGLPAGWVTDVPGITRNEALKLCGNGVVPQQAEAALRVLLSRQGVAA